MLAEGETPLHPFHELFSSALCAYGYEVGQRLFARMGIERVSTLADWRAPRWA